MLLGIKTKKGKSPQNVLESSKVSFLSLKPSNFCPGRGFLD